MDPPRGASHRKHTLLRLQHPEPTEENYARIQRSIEQQTEAVERARKDKRRYTASTANYAAAEKRLLAEENKLDVMQQALEDMRYAAGHRPMRRAVTPPPATRSTATSSVATPAEPVDAMDDDAGYVSDAGPGMLSTLASRASGLARGLAPVVAGGLARGAAGLVPLAGSVARGAGSIAGGIANKYADYRRRRAIEQAERAEAERINADIEERQLAEQVRRERAAQREEREEQLAAMPAEMSQIRREAEEAVAAGRRAKEEIARMKASEAEAATRREQQSPPSQPKLKYQPEPSSSESEEDEPIRKPAPLPPPLKPAFVVPPLNLPTPPPMPPRPKETFSLPTLPPTMSNYEEATRVAEENQRTLDKLLPRAEELARKANTAATLAQLDTEIEEAQRRRAAAKAEVSRKMANAAGFYTSKPEVGKEAPNKDFPTAPPSDSVLDNEVYKALKERGEKLADLTTKNQPRRSGVELHRPRKGKSATELEEIRRQIKASSAMAEATRDPNARFMYDFDPHHEDPHPNFDENYTLHRREDDANLKPLRPLADPTDYDRPPKRRAEPLGDHPMLDRVPPATPRLLQLPVEPDEMSSSAVSTPRSSSAPSASNSVVSTPRSSASNSVVSTPRSSSAASASNSVVSTPRSSASSSAAGSPIRFRSEPSPPRGIRLGRRGTEIKPLPPPVTADRPIRPAAQPPEMEPIAYQLAPPSRKRKASTATAAPPVEPQNRFQSVSNAPRSELLSHSTPSAAPLSSNSRFYNQRRYQSEWLVPEQQFQRPTVPPPPPPPPQQHYTTTATTHRYVPSNNTRNTVMDMNMREPDAPPPLSSAVPRVVTTTTTYL